MQNSASNSRITRAKALELANLILIAYDKNKNFLNKRHLAADELADLFPSSLACSSDPKFDETCPEHAPADHYEVISWLWHTDRPLNMLHLLRTLPFGFIAANHEKKELFIILRGTITSDEWRNNLITKPSASIEGSKSLGLVHEGFNNIFSLDYHDRLAEHASFLTRIGKTAGSWHDPAADQRKSIKDVIHEKVINADWLRKEYKILIAGHSLGGALSMLAGFLLSSHDSAGYSPNLSICTFGAPRVGTPEFSKWFEKVDVVRVVNTEDIVPTVPPPTTKIFGNDMNEFNDEKIRAERERGYLNISTHFGAIQGAMESEDDSDDHEAIRRAFVHIGRTISFTLNKGSISYNHNLSVTYREGIELAF